MGITFGRHRGGIVARIGQRIRRSRAGGANEPPTAHWTGLEGLESRLLMSSTPPDVGVNLSLVNAWEGGPMFVDIMEQANPWLSLL